MSDSSFRNWSLDTDMDGVCWLTLDREGESANSLSRDVLEELGEIVTRLENDPPAGLVLQSGKKGSFIVGADVREFDHIDDKEQAAEYIHGAHLLFNRIEALRFPTVVIIDGYCLGGGLELALCFDYRIARNDDKTRLGFPEVKLGIYPGFGGSARSVRQCGPLNAMPIMLSARNLRPGAARGIGLVDELVGPHGELRWAARRAILKGRKSKGPGRMASVQNMAPTRRLLAKQMRKQTAAKVSPDHYPAPFELIDAWEKCGDDPHAMMAEEVERVSRLITGDVSRNLRRIFFLTERLKGYGKQGKDNFKARRVHVVGAGTMGGDIASWCVVQGLEVTLQDREMKYIEPALKRAKKLFKKRLKTPDRVAGAVSRLIPDVEGTGAARADVIIEAIFENAEAKVELYRKLEPVMAEHAILATNTSALPLDELSASLDKPERLIGLHFFNPVSQMPLVEVVHAEHTDADEIARGAAFCNQIGRFPLPVKSSPGFLVNRVLAPYLLQAMRLHKQENIPAQDLDKAATRFGMPMGPVELADVVGLDIGLSVLGTLGGPDAEEERKLLKSYVDAGKLGKKTGEGFYEWEKGKPQKEDCTASPQRLGEIAERLLQPYFDECKAALADGIVEDGDVLDAGMIFGTGFAPFRGGPLHYLATVASHEAAVAQPAPADKEAETPEPARKTDNADSAEQADAETDGEKAS
ncbi:MAG: 3-hydroxyacyl-CoA dehydrogenase NAD-binding domain-containing protein [Xanthomonadales bacterium]|jgi:3-hydroxyacyl-CoA dehydrogenase/enoyl-CoA hydratase/3-hydroxybutyryl-CoA epimerase|nr:3-hydroxyacyl-CoA dehydrogenase NAD-binding domain-containing protein [Xanthomonadales bacterium]